MFRPGRELEFFGGTNAQNWRFRVRCSLVPPIPSRSSPAKQWPWPWQNVWPWQDLNLHTTRRDSNPQCSDPRSNALSIMPRAALPLSYMAGSILLYEEMTSVTMLQLALEPFLSLISFGEKGAREIFVCSEEIHSALQYSVVWYKKV